MTKFLLKDCSLSEEVSTDDRSFRLGTGASYQLLFQCSSSDEKQAWCKDLGSAINASAAASKSRLSMRFDRAMV